MAYYRLYIFQRGHISTFRAFEAADDALAIEEGRHLANGEQAELWSGARHVRDFRSLAAGTAA